MVERAFCKILILLPKSKESFNLVTMPEDSAHSRKLSLDSASFVSLIWREIFCLPKSHGALEQIFNENVNAFDVYECIR